MEERVFGIGIRDESGKTFSELKRLPDEDLMELVKLGNHDAFAALFDRYHRLVLSIAIKIVHDRCEAEDLMQEIFFEIYQKADAFDRNKGTAKYWLMRFAYARSLNRLHYLSARHFYHSPRLTELSEPDSGNNGHRLNGLTVEEWKRIIQQGLTTLKPQQRHALELATFNGYTFQEIAAIMNETLGNVRNHYYRGLKNLRKFLKEKSCLEGNLISSRKESIDVEQ
jgi:RNA polymerase sigma-70 factor (ECF subfamily)